MIRLTSKNPGFRALHLAVRNEYIFFLFGCWLVPKQFSTCPKNNGFAAPQPFGSYAFSYYCFNVVTLAFWFSLIYAFNLQFYVILSLHEVTENTKFLFSLNWPMMTDEHRWGFGGSKFKPPLRIIFQNKNVAHVMEWSEGGRLCGSWKFEVLNPRCEYLNS